LRKDGGTHEWSIPARRAWDPRPGFPPTSGPRAAKAGIRAYSRRGGFAQSWWGRRWVAVLDGLGLGGRLNRGRAYARRGQVLDIEVAPGRVTATVQGSRPDPYRVRLDVRTLAAAERSRLASTLRGQARFAALLLAGTMPDDVEAAFRDAGLTLFPERRGDLRTACSCPDAANPCKHVAAVYYLLGEELDRDPFLLFRLRGLERDDLLRRLRRPGGVAPHGRLAGTKAGAPSRNADGAELRRFWHRDVPPVEFGAVTGAAGSAAQLKRLGRFPFWRGAVTLDEVLAPTYAAARSRALDVYAGALASSRG